MAEQIIPCSSCSGTGWTPYQQRCGACRGLRSVVIVTYPDQTIMAGGDVPGNCFQAALAGVLGVSINAVPHFPLLGIHHWMNACVAWLKVEHCLIVNTSPDPSLGQVRLLHIINGQSPRGVSHAVIGDTTTGEMVHDPHPSRAGLNFINSRFYFHIKPSSAGVRLSVSPPEFKEASWGVDSVMRACTSMAVSEYTFREWAAANGIELADGVRDGDDV